MISEYGDCRKVVQLLLASSAMATLAACGGGGGNPSVGEFRTQEFRNSTGLDQIRAAQGYAQITGDQGGEGVVIAVLDDGVDEDHPDIAPNLIESIVPVGPDVAGPHGTAVAAIAAGDDDGGGTQGVAFDADLIVAQVATVNPADPTDIGLDTGIAVDVLDAIAAGDIEADIINMSFGFPVSGPLELSDGGVIENTSANIAAVEAIFGDVMQDVADAGKLMVIAAGNSRGAIPALEADLDEEILNIGADFPAQLASEVDDGAIVAIAVDENNELAEFSNSCFGVEDRCIAAPGVDFTGALVGGGTGDIGSGTSYAAPLVAGSAAVVQAAFPGVSPQEAGNRLLDTATDLGERGVDTTFGTGLLNLEEALSPQGGFSVAIGGRIDGDKASLSSTGLSLGSGLGLGGAGAELLEEVVVLDEDNFPFGVDLSGSAVVQSRTTGLEAFVASTDRRTAVVTEETSRIALSVAEDSWLDDSYRAEFAPGETSLAGGDRQAPRLSMRSEVSEGIDVFFGLNGSSATDAALTAALPELGGLFQPAAFLAPFDQLIGEQTGGGAALELGENSQLLLSTYASTDEESERSSTMQKIELVHKTEDAIRLKLGYGFVTEDGGYVGSAADGAFGSDSGGQSHVVDLAIVAPITERISLFGAYTEGRTVASGGSGLISDLSTLRSSAFGAGFVMKDVMSDGDGFSFVVGQPIRVKGGSAELTVPSGRTETGKVLTRSGRLDLTPDGREVAFEAAYDFALKEGQALSSGAFLRLDPDHQDDAKPDVGFGLNYKISF